MQTSKLTKSILGCLVIFGMMVLGMFIARDISQTSTDSQYGTTTQLLGEQTGLGADRPCLSLTIYTSLPAKCKTVDGKFIELGGMQPNVLVVPEGK